MSKLKRVSLWAAFTAVVVEGMAKNLALSALVTIGAPATATGFVYEVMQMRHANLEREAHDRVSSPSKSQNPAAMGISGEPPESSVDKAAGATLKHRLESMVITRSQFLDIYGGNPEALTAVTQKMLRGMLAGDGAVLSEVEAERIKNFVTYERDLSSSAAHLRELHDKLAALLPPDAPGEFVESRRDGGKSLAR